MVILRPVSYWYFIIVALISGFIAAYTLRQNNLTALRLRDKVLQVDKENGDVESALRELREYTYSHMNSQLSSDTGIYPPIQLKYRYERLVIAEQERVRESNKDIYAAAQQDCERRFPSGFSGSNRLPCIMEYIDTHATPDARPQPIPEGLYKFDFVSPVWSPDIAGWSLVIASVAMFFLIIRIAAQIWLRHQLET